MAGVAGVRVLKSRQDASVNFVIPYRRGFLEARLVRRPRDQNKSWHLTFYLSSHSGCRMACHMCHLTQTGQQSFAPADEAALTCQFRLLLQYYVQHSTNDPAEEEGYHWVYVNFMARGEPLLNPVLRDPARLAALVAQWERLCSDLGLRLRINVSTIMPTGHLERVELHDVLGNVPVHLYYSLYSLNPAFRRRWLPAAMDPERALDKLRRWEDRSGIPITFHWPLISGQNDSDTDVDALVETIRSNGFKGRYHLVRYNPPPKTTEVETPDERRAVVFRRLASAFPDPQRSKVIARVGEEVHASCGTFFAS